VTSHQPPTHLVLPIRGEYWCCRYESGDVRPMFPLLIDGEAPPDVLISDMCVSDEGIVAFKTRRGERLNVVSARGEIPVTMPSDLGQIQSLLFVGDVLFVGGVPRTNPNTRLGFIDTQSPQPRWTPVDLPDTLGGLGSIVAMVRYGSRLVALDSSFTPKLLLCFDVSDPRDPLFVSQARIPSGIDDEIAGIAAGRSYLAVLSSTRHKDGKAWKIGIYDRFKFDEISTFFHRVPWQEPLHAPDHLAFLDDLLLISHGLQGLGVARLQDTSPTQFSHRPPTQPWTRPYIPLSNIRYTPPLAAGRVVFTIPLSANEGVIAVTRRGNQYWWERVDL